MVSIFMTLSIFTLPFGVQTYHSHMVRTASTEVLSALRLAQSNAVAQKFNQSSGVRVIDGGGTLFIGPSYAARASDEDVSIPFADSVNISGLEEIVFSRGSGRAQTLGSVVFEYGSFRQEISVGSIVIELL